MEYLMGLHDEDDRQYLSLLDLTNAAWPDLPRTAEDAQKLGESISVLRVRSIRIKLETRPAR
jgi:hypothetical protein